MTRQWMCDPQILCMQHLVGEHKEVHQLVGQLRQGKHVRKYIEHNCIEPLSIHQRHDNLAHELLRRKRLKYPNRTHTHASPLTEQIRTDHLHAFELRATVDVEAALADLTARCASCARRYEIFMQGYDPEQPDTPLSETIT